jgi:hypothetical protein
MAFPVAKNHPRVKRLLADGEDMPLIQWAVKLVGALPAK